ncbi:hypothetical protein NX059_000654 [Plenodomus lindquistii]|nr:hypothetical protein NX059_000654 [Plenodomus lindquistii]
MPLMRPQDSGSSPLAIPKLQSGVKNSAGSATWMCISFRRNPRIRCIPTPRSCRITSTESATTFPSRSSSWPVANSGTRTMKQRDFERRRLAIGSIGLPKAWRVIPRDRHCTVDQALRGRPRTTFTVPSVRCFQKYPKLISRPSSITHSKRYSILIGRRYSAYTTQGTNRVGNAKELSLARRVQLAVVAHIRHTYTDYDKLLKTDGWSTARSQVEHVSLAKLKEWRDEAGEQSNELEETFREVIVLDDDDTSSDEDSLATPDEREQSMEIVSNRATARDLQPERYTDYPRVDIHDMRRAPRRTIVLQRAPPPPQATAYPGPAFRSPALEPPYEHVRSLERFVESHPSPRADAYHLAHSRPSDQRVRPNVSQPGLRAAPMMREIDGQLYQLQPIEEPRGKSRVVYDQSPHRATSRYAHDGYVPSPVRPSSFDRPPAHPRRPSEQDEVLPSVEREMVDLTSPQRVEGRQRRPLQALDYLPKHQEVHSPKRRAYTPPFDGRPAPPPDSSNKRLRPVLHDEDLHRYAQQDGLSRLFPHQPLDLQRAPPPPQVVDLTSTPYRGAPESGYRAPARLYQPALELDDQSYVPVSARPPPPREARDAYYGMAAEVPSHAYMSEHRMTGRPAPPTGHDFPPLMDDHQRYYPDEGARYLRSGVKYGG